MSGLELNKIAAAVLLAGLLAMIAGALANVIYHPDIDPEKRGYKVDVADAPSKAGAKKEEVIDLAALLASASVESGQKTSKKCVACHSFDKGGKTKVGPNLWGILGDQMAREKDFNYSAAMIEKGKAVGWDYDNLYAFLSNPKKYLKGTKMAFAGLRKPKDAANVIAYIRSLSDTPYPLPEPTQPNPTP